MPSFQPMFTESKGQPIEYQGKTLVMSDFYPTQGVLKFRLVFESCNGSGRQGVGLRLLYKDRDGKWQKGAAAENEGQLIVRGANTSGKDGVIIWCGETPKEEEFEVVGSPSVVNIFNVWAGSDGVTHSRHHGAAMIVEELPNGRRYQCNDGEPDEDFDDIIFRLERVV
jgi:hypothetical protein